MNVMIIWFSGVSSKIPCYFLSLKMSKKFSNEVAIDYQSLQGFLLNLISCWNIRFWAFWINSDGKIFSLLSYRRTCIWFMYYKVTSASTCEKEKSTSDGKIFFLHRFNRNYYCLKEKKMKNILPRRKSLEKCED